MALSAPQDTLAYHQSRVLTTNRAMASVPCSQVAHQIKQYSPVGESLKAVPEAEALWFYGLNHGMSLIQSEYAPLEPLQDWDLDYVKRYHAKLAPSAVRAFYYLLLICTREARHNKSLTKDLPEITKRFGKPVATFFQNIKGGESSIHQKFLSSPPNASIGAYVKSLQWVFYNSSWNGGYGGKAWGAVTDCLVRFVTGEFTAEMMLDTNWTLAHNNGPIFNKGIFYQMYSAHLVRILDVQRSGQIPEAILHDPTISVYAVSELSKIMKDLTQRFPGKIGSYVDWYVVEGLGAVHTYGHEKEKQVAKHGLSEWASVAEKKAKAAAAAKAEAEKKAKELYEKTHFIVMPGVALTKITREAA